MFSIIIYPGCAVLSTENRIDCIPRLLRDVLPTVLLLFHLETTS